MKQCHYRECKPSRRGIQEIIVSFLISAMKLIGFIAECF
jgi:hypothetical protein